MNYFLIVICAVLFFSKPAYSQDVAESTEHNLCKRIVLPQKTFAYLTDDKFKQLGDIVDLGEIHSIKESDGFISDRSFYVIASKNLIDNQPFLSSHTQRVTLTKINSPCKNVSLFKLNFVMLDPTVFGKPGPITGEFPYVGLENIGAVDVQGPKKFTGTLKMYELNFSIGSHPQAMVVLNPANEKVTTLTFINNGNLSVRLGNWEPYYDKDAHWIEILENRCIGHELQPQETCTAKIRWGESGKLEDRQVWKAAVEVDDSSVKLEVNKQGNGAYMLKIGEEFSTE